MRVILLAGVAQLLFTKTSPHAAVDLAVEATRREPHGAGFAGLANAVLRRVAREGAAVLAGQDSVRLNVPAWLWQRWSRPTAPTPHGASPRQASGSRRSTSR